MWIFSRYWRYSARPHLPVRRKPSFQVIRHRQSSFKYFIKFEWFKNSASYEDPQCTSVSNVNTLGQCTALFDDSAQFSPFVFHADIYRPTPAQRDVHGPNCAKFGKDIGPSSKLNKIPLDFRYLAPFGKKAALR